MMKNKNKRYESDIEDTQNNEEKILERKKNVTKKEKMISVRESIPQET